MRSRTWDLVSIGSLAASALATVAVYERLPDPIATHFDLEGRANGWMPRAVGAWFVPVFGLALWALVRFLPRVLPGADRKRLAGPLVALFAALTTVFMAAVHGLLLYVAVVPGATLTRSVWLLTGALFVAMGLVLPRVRRNPILGVRTAWTLTSDENWARTHRVAGYTMVLGGVCAAAAGTLGGAAGGVVALSSLLAAGLVPVVYSLVIARRSDPGGNGAR
jgi:uncharacterized membrane protein